MHITVISNGIIAGEFFGMQGRKGILIVIAKLIIYYQDHKRNLGAISQGLNILI